MLDERKATDPPGRGGGVHRHRPARGFGPRRARARRQRLVGHGPQRHGRCSSRRATSASPTPAPAGSPPRRATGSSSTRWPARRPLGPRRGPAGAGVLRQGPRRARADARTTPAACCRTSPTTPRWSSARPTRRRRPSVQLVGLAPRVALLVVVLSNGAVEKRTLELDAPTSATSVLAAAGAHLAAHLDGRHLGAAGRRDRRRRPEPSTRSSTRCADVGAPPSGAERRHRSSSAARRGWPRAFDAVETVRERARHPRAAVRGRHPAARRARPRPAGRHRHRDRHGDRSPTARWSWRPTRSTARPAGTIGVLGPTRMNYPQALAAVAVVSKRLGRRLTRRLSQRGADYYELLGVARDATAGRDQEGLPPARPRAAPRRQPRRRRRRGAVQGGRRRLRDAERPRAARQRYDRFGPEGLRACGGRRPVRLRAAASATSSTRSSAAAAVRRRRSGPTGPPPGRRPRGRRRPRLRGGGVRRAGTGRRCAPPCACEDVRGDRRGHGHVARDLPRLRRRRPGAARAPVAPRPDGDRRPVPPLRRARARSSPPRARLPGRGPQDRREDLHRRRPRRRRHRARPCASPGSGRRRARVAAPHGDLYVHLRVAEHERFERHGDDLVCTSCPSRSPRRRSAQPSTSRPSTAPRSSWCRAAPRPGTTSRFKGRGVPRLGGRGRGDLEAELVVEVPTDLDDDQEALVRQLAELRGEALAEQPEGLLSRVRSAFKG